MSYMFSNHKFCHTFVTDFICSPIQDVLHEKGRCWSFTTGLQQKRFAHQNGQENTSRADIRFTRLRMTLRVFFISIGLLRLRRFGGQTRSSVFTTSPKRTVPGHDWMVDNSRETQLLLQVFLIYCHLEMGTEPQAGFD